MVTISRSDGSCRKCGGLLNVVDADSSSMLVRCEECGDTTCVEPDSFGDGGLEYWPAILAELAGGG